MYVSSRSIVNLEIKKGCKDDQDFLDLQTGLPFYQRLFGLLVPCQFL
jgi:hypothetical protein